MAGIKALLLDIDGVLYEGENVVEGALDAVRILSGRFPVRFITNTTRKTHAMVHEKLRSMGFDVESGSIFTALDAAKSYLEQKDATAYLLLYRNVAGEFAEYLGEHPDYVVVADAYIDFTYENLNTAFRHLMDGSKLLAIAKNRYFKDKDGALSLDAGGFVALLEFAAQKEATILGKPSRNFFHLAAASMGVEPSEVLMVGDDIESDVLGAQRAGMKACQVKTGKFRPEDLQRGIEPDCLLDSIADLPGMLLE
ncbi:TIGR01458 family HAD-type hydrolase [Hydrogenimonas cancrithermarum]|uniref:Haloacid dehalogenase-like hydrolase domain-containing protein 2 n=1 Tax=Hydrogenimonas cancrithermarum TaxID=2993563 RepID=A0ABM8FP53_9BACT|nr:TIGR01458 family HAD-type hydrolase [Hydrogenimonas cancrithermarum]BDY13699.1 haloacid dehalogenase [Hydrogenimonas cancrithermarum]